MKIINYFDSVRREHWLEEIKKCDWAAGAFLYELLTEGRLFEMAGEDTQLLLLTDGDELISFCTLAERDDIPDCTLTPWVGFVYTFPRHRGHHRFGLLLEEAGRRAKEKGRQEIYISTDHIGLYEKYGCEFLTEMKDMHGSMSRVYVKRLEL